MCACERDKERERDNAVKTDTETSVAALRDMQLTFVYKENIFQYMNL